MRESEQVGNNEEIGCIVLFFDNLKLVKPALFNFRVIVQTAPSGPLEGQLVKHLVSCFALFQFKVWKNKFAQIKFYVASFSNFFRICHRFRNILEPLKGFFGGYEMILAVAGENS